MSGRASKMYKTKPHMERDEHGDMAVKKLDGAEKKGETGEVSHEGEHSMRHHHERMAMHHRHVHEHLAMHHKHEVEHHHHEGPMEHIHERHEKEYAEMHHKHHSEMKKMHKKHEEEGHGEATHKKEMKSEEKGDEILNKATKGGETEKE